MKQNSAKEDRATKLEELTKKLSTEEGRDIEQEGKDAKLNSAQQKISQIKGLMEHSKARSKPHSQFETS